ncbi:MAG: 2-C-methyl-D-erythritol 2,4-cyclodiphosphate synthase [Defluviitaleaceae bacterium]|nr:2-C-methyl-D-erythritol 2,4-cyclodiphosphate synthase [Defluviitaleaceae bacterium]
MRIGIGYDSHRLVEGRPLVLGGCIVPFQKGLLGHSDADVLIHAVIDALLGAAALGDIGRHFPDTDNRYKNASSLHMLGVVGEMIRQASLSVGNIDGIIVAQRPKLAEFMPLMAENIAKVLDIPIGAVNIKAKTEEGMGFVGMGEGMTAQAVALLIYKRE